MATNLDTLRTRLKEIDAWLNTGATSVSLDGVTVAVNQAELKAERNRIQNQLPEFKRSRKAVAYRVTGLGG